jgi:hypothetical protein
MALRSKIGKTSNMSHRVTIPQGIMDYLDLKGGDTLYWKMHFFSGLRDDEVKVVIVSREELK